MSIDPLSTGGGLPLVDLKFEGPNLNVSDVEADEGLNREFSAFTTRKANLEFSEIKYLPERLPYSHICTICGDSFEGSISLEKHLVMHNNAAPFECPYCANLIEDLKEFSDHIMMHVPKLKLLTEPETQSNLQKCSENEPLEQLGNSEADHLLEEQFCDTPNPVESPQTPVQEPKLGLLPWQARDNKIRPYNCIECNRSFTLASSLALHNKRKHLLIKQYECNICSSAFVQSSDLYKHKRTHTGEKPYHCEKCGARFSQKRNLRNHKNMHSNSKHKCSYCGLGFQNEASLMQHVKTHEGEQSNICTICSIPYADQTDLDLHVKHAHEIAPSDAICLVCEKSFNSRSELTQHSIKHTKLYTCDTCGKSFAHRTSLINHRVVHTGKKTYQCAYCGQAFGFSGNLKAHTRIHTGERPFECEICQKTFARSANLKEHLKTHTGERPINCDLCGKAFTSSSGYAKHRKIHTGERPHKCKICSRTFVQMVHLNKHILTHTGEKPHQCEVCRKFYRRKDTLAKHLQSHEVKEPVSSGDQDLVHAIRIEFIDLPQ